MRLHKNILVYLLAAAMLFGCSREGFKDSLSAASSQAGSSTESSESQTSNAAYEFDFDTIESTEEEINLYYVLPRAKDTQAEDAAANISEKIESAISGFKKKVIDGKTVYRVNIFDGITKNDGTYYSAIYEAELRTEKDAPKEKYCFGLAFDSRTGELMGINAVMKPDELVALILDEQTSKISEKDEALAAKKRAFLNEQGAENLKQKLFYEDGVVSVDRLMQGSFYLDGAKLVAVFAAPQDIGGVIKVSIPL